MTYAIIGGGIVGISVAYHLSEASDERVIVFERGELATETTAKSGAFFAFWGRETPPRYEMKQYGARFYNGMLSEATAWVRTTHLGRLGFASSKTESRRLRKLAASADRDDVAAMTEYFTRDELEGSFLLPDVRTEGVEGAIYRPNVACFEPRPMARLLAGRARANGVQFETDTSVRRLLLEDGTVRGVVTENGRVNADHVVCAAGPWVPKIARQLGLDLPVRYSFGPMLRLRPDDPIGERLPSLKQHDDRIYLRRDFDGTILLGHRPQDDEEGADSLDPDSLPASVPGDLRETMIERASEMIPALERSEVADEWVGLRTLTPDDNPIVDCTSIDGFAVTAMNAEGLQLAPAAGKIIADRLVGERAIDYYHDISLERF